MSDAVRRWVEKYTPGNRSTVVFLEVHDMKALLRLVEAVDAHRDTEEGSNEELKACIEMYTALAALVGEKGGA